MSKASRVAVFALAGIVLVEVIGASTLILSSGEWMLWTKAQARRAELLERLSGVGPLRSSGSGGDPLSEDVVHPYLGFVADASRNDAVNEYGFLGEPDPVQTRSPDRFIVAVVGGSVAEDLATVGAESLASAIGRLPVAAERQLVLVNLARGTYKQPQQLLAVGYMLSLGAEFDLVINIDGFNEVALHAAGNARKRVFPAYPANWYLSTSSVPDPRVRRAIGRRADLEERMAALARLHSRAPLRLSMACNAIWALRQRALSARHAKLEREIRSHATRKDERLPYWVQGPSLTFDGAEPLYAFLASIWERGSRQLANLCRENDILYLHLLQPDPLALGPQKLDPAFEPGCRGGYPRLVEGGRRLTREGVRFVDLTPEFARGARSPYRGGGCDLTDAGRTALIERVAKAIAAEKAVAER